MRLPAQRRDLVVWSPSVRPAATYGAPRLTRLARTRRIRRFIRTGALLTVIGLRRLARAARARRRLLLTGGALTVAVVMLHSGGALLLPGLLFLFTALLIPVSPDADRKRCFEPERELPAVRASIPFWSSSGGCAVPWEPDERG
jgi:hypothetical protein